MSSARETVLNQNAKDRLLQAEALWAMLDPAGFPADEAREEKHTRVTFEISLVHEVVRLTVTHDRLESGSEMHQGIAEGWPKVLSSLKSLLETGRPLPQLW